MQLQRFLLHCDKDGTFTLKLQDESWNFEKLTEALRFAQDRRADGEARLTVFDSNGNPTIETFV